MQCDYHMLISLSLSARTLATVKVNKVRYVVWSADMAYVALLGKHGEFFFPEICCLRKWLQTNNTFILCSGVAGKKNNIMDQENTLQPKVTTVGLFSGLPLMDHYKFMSFTGCFKDLECIFVMFMFSLVQFF